MPKHELPSSGFLVNDRRSISVSSWRASKERSSRGNPSPPTSSYSLQARSPVFNAQFFGGIQETSSRSVEITDMEAHVFRSMLHFVYTDMAPELEAQHLLEAADRYGLNRLKQMCECKLSGGISIDTAATMLAFAEQHNCSLLKANCVDFVTKSLETLDAVLATEGYAHLVASCPSVLAELLRAARERTN